MSTEDKCANCMEYDLCWARTEEEIENCINKKCTTITEGE